VVVSILDEQETGLALGASAYLTKPVSRQDLLETIRDVVERSDQPGRGLRVLAVDDDPAARELIVLALEATPHHVVQATGAMQALELLDEAPADLVIVDLIMEPIDGFELIEMLAQRPDMQGIPIVVLTARELTREDVLRLKGRPAATLSKHGFRKRQFLHELQRVTSAADKATIR
jgi:CheY-like chemotaxis protein